MALGAGALALPRAAFSAHGGGGGHFGGGGHIGGAHFSGAHFGGVHTFAGPRGNAFAFGRPAAVGEFAGWHGASWHGAGWHGAGWRGAGWRGAGWRGAGWHGHHHFRNRNIFVYGGGWPYYDWPGYSTVGFYGGNYPDDYYSGYPADYSYPYPYPDNTYGYSNNYGTAPVTTSVVYRGGATVRRAYVVGGVGDVVEMQRLLRRDGYYAGPIDGIYGPRTRAALRSWRVSHRGL